MTYTFPYTPYYYNYDMEVIDGIVAFCSPNNYLSHYNFAGYGNNTIQMYGNGVVEIRTRDRYFDTVVVPEPASFIILAGALLLKRLRRKRK